jgi:hypothetical protein
LHIAGQGIEHCVRDASLTPMSALASMHDFFQSTAFQVARNDTIFFVVLFWLGLAHWEYRDARRRVDDPWLSGTAMLVGLVPFVGPLVYLLFRPPETLDEMHARRVEIDALESRFLKQTPHCPVCHTEVEPAFIVCPVCTTALKEPCTACGAPLDRLWQACPFCATPVTRGGMKPAAFDLDTALTAEALVHGNGGAGKARTPRKRRSPATERTS